MRIITRFLITTLVTTLAPCLTSNLAQADLTVTLGGNINACEDFATNVLDDAWDMSNSADVVNFTTNDLSYITNPNFSQGLFNYTGQLTGGATFRLLAPRLPSTQAVSGRWGINHPIDTSKYKSMTVRMSTTTLDDGQGLRFVWHRTSDYGKQNTYTTKTTTRTGWANYTVDFSSVGIDGASDNTNLWSTGNIEGLGVLPSVTTQNISVDYVRLEDPTTCGSTTVNYSFLSTSNNEFYNLYVDSDSNPFNGYYKKIATMLSTTSGNTTINALGLMPGAYKITGIQESDYATLLRDDPWDMSQSTDIQVMGEVTSPVFNNGILAGTSSSTSGPQFYPRLATGQPLNLSTFNKLSFKISPPVSVLIWGKNGTQLASISANSADGNGVYNLDMSNNPNWTGTTDSLIIVPAWTSGVSFTFDFFQVRSRGFVTSDTPSTAVEATSSLNVISHPTLKIVEPGISGGEAIKPWNFRGGEHAFSVNIDTATDTTFPGELLSAYLPDVRRVQNLRGDFYKGTNISGNDDPNDYLTFPNFTTTNNFLINADEYRNMCLKMALNRDYDLALGSVTKLVFHRSDGAIEELDAWGTIFDRWSDNKWQEYCSDLTTHPTEKGEVGRWSGNLTYLRIDPHEFHLDNCCDAEGDPIGNPIQATYYYDYLKLRKDDVSHGKYTIVYNATDPDSTNLTTSFYYNTSKSSSNGNLITPSSLTCEGQVCIWNTSGIAAGTYYIYGVTSDGVTSNTSIAPGRVKVLNDSNTQTAPILSVESPQSNSTVCSNLQLKGYTLISERYEDVSALQVFLDESYLTSLSPRLYSPKAVVDYPLADSSNTGFNEMLNVSGWSNGTHTLTLKSYASDGGTTTKSFTINKTANCTDPATVTDAEPAGTTVPATPLDSSVGSGLSLTVNKSDTGIQYTMTGTRNCNIVRIGTATSPNDSFTWIYGNSDQDILDSNLLSIKSSVVPRFIGNTSSAPAVTTQNDLKKLKAKLKKTTKMCRRQKGKKRQNCTKTIKKLKKQIKNFKPVDTSTYSTAVYFIADCNQGEITSSSTFLESTEFGNPDGSPCAAPTTLKFGDWFSCYASTLALNTTLE